MPNTDQIPARPPVFGCTATHGGLDAAWVDVVGELDIVHTIVEASLRGREEGRRLVLVRGRPDVYRIFVLTGSSGDVDIGDLDPVEAPALQRTLVSQSLLGTSGMARHRRPSQ